MSVSLLLCCPSIGGFILLFLPFLLFLFVLDCIYFQGINILEIAEQYDNILSDLKSHCGILLSLTETLDTVKTEARLAQSALYDTAQAVSKKCLPQHLFNPRILKLIRNFSRSDF